MKAKDYFSDPRLAELADAADHGDARAVEKAIASGASPNGEGKDAITPLFFVLSSSRNKTGLRALLRAGADPNQFTPKGLSPLVLAARAPDPEFLTIMLNGGGNPNLKNHGGEPVLHTAALDERWENIDNLLRHGADINVVDGGGYTLAMNVAIARKYDRLLGFLERGSDPLAVARNGDTLAKIVERVNVRPDSPQADWREKVVQFLRQRGIVWPPK
jgi:ankyrin repeat protein